MNKMSLRFLTVAAVGLVTLACEPPVHVAFASPVEASTTDVQDLRATRQRYLDEIDAAETALARLEDKLATGGFHAVYDRETGVFVFTTLEDALFSWTLTYLHGIAREGRPFDRDELASILREVRDAAAALEGKLRNDVDFLEQRIDRLRRELIEVENEIDELERSANSEPGHAVPGSAENCVHRVRIDRQGALGASSNVSGAVHSVRIAGQSARGWPADFTLQWTAPPETICAGQTYTVTFSVRNGAPVEDRLLGRAALVGMTFDPAAGIDFTCTNPPGFDPRTSSYVAPWESARDNTCAVEIVHVPDLDQPKALINVTLDSVLGYGGLAYVYER